MYTYTLSFLYPTWQHIPSKGSIFGKLIINFGMCLIDEGDMNIFHADNILQVFNIKVPVV